MSYSDMEYHQHVEEPLEFLTLSYVQCLFRSGWSILLTYQFQPTYKMYSLCKCNR